MKSTLLTPNTYVIRAILHSIVKIESNLSQAVSISSVAAGTPMQIYSREIHQGVFENLTRLLSEAQNLLQNIEFTLEEEIHYIKQITQEECFEL